MLMVPFALILTNVFSHIICNNGNGVFILRCNVEFFNVFKQASKLTFYFIINCNLAFIVYL
ncbi:hypothetical protein MCHI_001479 [Candidatus Magnetoovum chiemensis]|nr:hypothetical protein MCHI_001479 [Candidatus Magnetoovum chiemensis]